jgi:predicted methyltransferase
MPIRTASLLAGVALCLIAPRPVAAESTFDQEIRLLVELLRIAPGDVVADIGAGDGEYAIALARVVGDAGRVYATELEEDDRAAIALAAREAAAQNVVVETARIDGTGLPAASCDGAFLRTVYHHLTEPDAMARSLFATIRPGGRLVVIDFPPSFWLGWWTPEGIPDDRDGHGVRPELVVSELEAAGFVRTETVEKWPGSGFVTKQYAVAFDRP